MARDLSKYLSFNYEKKTSEVFLMHKDINDFIAQLHEAQLDYLDEAVELSDYRDAKEVIKHIMSLK